MLADSEKLWLPVITVASGENGVTKTLLLMIA